MQSLDDSQLDAVAGGQSISALLVFVWTQLDHVRDMVTGMVDGFMDGANGKAYEPDSVYTGP